MELHLPNYEDGSIVNLMSSIGESFGHKTLYRPLPQLPPEKLKESQNIILMVLDGLGFEFLTKKAKGSTLASGLKAKITSVFPPTTAAAITSFATGLAPQQHAYTGWFMHLKEIGAVSTILPFSARFNFESLSDSNYKVEDFLDVKAFSSNLHQSSYFIIGDDISGSATTNFFKGSSHLRDYTNLDWFFAQIRLAASNPKKKYIYAYWSKFDSHCHEFGIDSKETKAHFDYIDKKFSNFIQYLDGTSTTLIVTADHGLIDTTKERVIMLNDHPDLKKCLTLPLCGEPRAAYCYVKPSRAKQFEEYVKSELDHVCEAFKSEELIEQGWFGLGEPNPKLFDRVGDYTLITKENYNIKDELLHMPRPFHVGNHGGVSKEEMYVPLMVFNL